MSINVYNPKYPRTPHLPWSPGVSNDDKIIKDLHIFENFGVTITIKMDGSNVGLSNRLVSSRSGQLPTHPSFDMLKQNHAAAKPMIVDDAILFAEWLYAKHSIEYKDLETYLMGFGMYNVSDDSWASMATTKRHFDAIGVSMVPTIGHFRFEGVDDLQQRTTEIAEEVIADGHEGIVIRYTGPFNNDSFSSCVAKYVRKDHVKTDKHWSKNWKRNRLKSVH